MSKKRDNAWNFRGAEYLTRKETKYISVSFFRHDMSAYDFGRLMLTRGWFNTGYHYIIHTKDATMETGIPLKQYADPSVNGWNDSICLLVMGIDPRDKLQQRDWIKNALPWVRKELKLTLPLKE